MALERVSMTSMFCAQNMIGGEATSCIFPSLQKDKGLQFSLLFYVSTHVLSAAATFGNYYVFVASQ